MVKNRFAIKFQLPDAGDTFETVLANFRDDALLSMGSGEPPVISTPEEQAIVDRMTQNAKQLMFLALYIAHNDYEDRFHCKSVLPEWRETVVK